MFKLFKKRKKEINNHYRDHSYINARIDSAKKYPDDLFLQLDYMKKTYGVKFHMMRMTEIAQVALRDTKESELELHPVLLEYMTRGFMDALAHMQDDLPNGVYGYIENNTDTFFYKCIEHATAQKRLTDR